MKRYYYYFIALNMLVNVMVYVPKLLLNARDDGMMVSMVSAIVIGWVTIKIFSRSLRTFPDKGVPEIMMEQFGAVFAKIVLAYGTVMWYTAGFITLLGIGDILHNFVNPEVSIAWINAILLVPIMYMLFLPIRKLLYCVQSFLVLTSPFVLLITWKAVASSELDWDLIRETVMRPWRIPEWSTICAATYVFSGYANMVIFHRVAPAIFRGLAQWGTVVFGVVTLALTVLIPIGILGFDAIDQYTFPWVVTADAIRLEFGPVERLLYVFLLLYMIIALLSVVVHWSVAREMIVSVLGTKRCENRTLIMVKAGLFAGIALLASVLFEEQWIFKVGSWWLMFRFPSELFLVFMVYWAARKAEKRAAPQKSSV